ncbi:MAG: IS110 family transposase, partial [Clostridia bacterium]|nr:IS110 family transposase [Clostridia bacterium]
MKKAYIGTDAHKEQNVIALALAGREDPELYGKAPADLDGFERVLRRVLAKYG